MPSSFRPRAPMPLALVSWVALAAAGCSDTLTAVRPDLDNASAHTTSAATAPSAADSEEALDWRVGFTWPFMTDNRLIAATEMALRTCVLGQVEGLETAEILQTGRRFDVSDTTTGERLFWMEISGDPTAATNKTLDLNWREGLGSGAGPRFLTQVDRAVRGQQPC